MNRTPEHYGRRLSYLHGLASAQMRMSERTGDLSGADEAIALWRDVVMATPDDHPAKPGRLSALATAMLLRSHRDPSDARSLDTAIGILGRREPSGLDPPEGWRGSLPDYWDYLQFFLPVARRLGVSCRDLDRALWKWSQAGMPDDLVVS